MNIRSFLLLLTICAMATLFVGCGKEKTYTVEGTVTYKGEAVAQGAISFVPEDPKKCSQGATIADGKYTAQVRAGNMTVKITGSKPHPKEKMSDGSPVWVDYIPEEHNIKSTLHVEIKGNQTENFDLK